MALAVVKVTGNFNNIGVPAPSGQFGAFTLEAVQKLLAVRVVIENVQAIDSIGTSTAINGGAMIGVQVVFQGGTPNDLPAGANLVNFLDHMPVASTDAILAWAPSTDVAGHQSKAWRNLKYHGQKFFGAALDLYVTWGSGDAPLNQTYSGYVEAIYSTA